MIKHTQNIILSALLTFFIIGCGGGGSNTQPSQPPEENLTIEIPVESVEGASAFLSHATYGVRKEDIAALYAMGGYDIWLNDQFSKPSTKLIPWIDKYLGINKTTPTLRDALFDAWYSVSVNADDQLRQKVALALSEIIVVSIIGVENGYAVADYYDLLLDNAFGNYRDILHEIALHPAMGIYLSTLGNMKEHNTTEGTVVHADENFAREILQLFSIGLVQLQTNGQPLLVDGHTVPTYTQRDIEEFAKVYTGWTNDNGYFYYQEGPNTLAALTKPMIAIESYHDTRGKEFSGTFSYPYGQIQKISEGLSASADLNAALDIIFNHPNLGPFIGKQLIQRLVTSNPSPEYVERVTSVFNDNGEGIRGDMKAVIKAILTDKEALLEFKNENPNILTHGKLREQLIRIAAVMRTFHAKGDPAIPEYQFYNFKEIAGYGLHLRALNAPSVFNYYLPTFKPSGILQDNNLSAPEFQVMPPLKMSTFGSVMLSIIGLTDTLNDKITLNLDYEKNLLNTSGSQALIDHLNLILLSGQMSDSLKQDLLEYCERKKTAHDIIEQLIALIVLSAEYAIER